jgi:ATP-binding cassette, subfamily B, bacterial
VVVLHDGRIAEQGPPAQLLAADGRFARLWRAGELEPPADAESEDADLDRVVSEARTA